MGEENLNPEEIKKVDELVAKLVSISIGHKYKYIRDALRKTADIVYNEIVFTERASLSCDQSKKNRTGWPHLWEEKSWPPSNL